MLRVFGRRGFSIARAASSMATVAVDRTVACDGMVNAASSSADEMFEIYDITGKVIGLERRFGFQAFRALGASDLV